MIKERRREGIQIAKRKGRYKGKQRQYHKDATGKNKIIYDEIVRLLNAGVKKVEIARRTGLSRPTINKIEKELDKGL